MSINESLEETQAPVRQIAKQQTQTARQRTSSKTPSSAGGSSTQSQRPDSSYTVFRRDILYRAINENQLSGSKLSSYTDLLTRLGFDLTPLVSQGQTWYLCRGKQNDRSPCRRMVPEVYLRTAVGKILKAADTPELKHDDLVDTLATALSYAICSEHHRTVHKFARAIECRQVVDEWREQRPPTGGSSTPIRVGSPISGVSPFDDAPRTPSPNVKQEIESESAPAAEEAPNDPVASYGESERLKVEKHYQEYLRASAASRGRRSGSDAGSSTSSVGEYSEQRWRLLENAKRSEAE